MRQECTYSTPMEPKMNNKELSNRDLTLDDVKRLLEDLAEECEMISSFAKELIKFYRL